MKDIIQLPILIGLALSLAVPWIIGSAYHYVLIMMILYAYLATAWNILGGITGQLSLGHSMFFGIGAYFSSVLSVYFGFNPWFGMIVGGIAAALLGLFIGVLSFHYGLKGPYFALVTIAFSQAVLTLFLNIDFFGAASGFKIPLKPSSFIDLQFSSKLPYYYIGLSMLIFILLITRWIQRNQIGHYFMAIRDNEELAQGLGVNLIRYKVLATVISAFFTGVAGTFYAQYFLYIDPRDVVGIELSIELALFSIVGGSGTLFGPMLGAFTLTLFGELTRTLIGAEWGGGHVMIYGLILMLVIIFVPKGIMGFVRERSR